MFFRMYAFMVARTISTSILRHYIHIVAIQYVYPLGYSWDTAAIQSIYSRYTAAIQSQYSTCIISAGILPPYSRNTVRVSSGIQSQYSTCILWDTVAIQYLYPLIYIVVGK